MLELRLEWLKCIYCSQRVLKKNILHAWTMHFELVASTKESVECSA